MAEMNTSPNAGNKKGSGVKKGKKLSTRVDLTPMVDLGFLLITFFIFTTTMSDPMALHLGMTADGPPTDVKNSCALTIMLGKNNSVFYYEGELQKDAANIKVSNFKDIRNVILNKKRTLVKADMIDNFMVMIKPDDECSYQNIIATLDEMAINKVEKYALADIAKVELDYIAKK